MEPWTATVNGTVLGIGTHLHDGGSHIDILKNDEVVCRSVAAYGDVAKHIDRGRKMDMSHISHMSDCLRAGRIEEGEAWSLKAQYDLETHEPMLDGDGKPEGVMGIAIMLVIED